jgi:CRISPR type III-A-associated RAMP protein Csm4
MSESTPHSGGSPWCEMAYVLWPQGRQHFGAHPADLSRSRPFPSSDTLFGALAWAIASSAGAVALQRWLDPFLAGDPPLLVTSVLPLTEGEAPRVLVPVPARRPAARQDQADPSLWKLLRGADYMDLDVLKWFHGAATAFRRADDCLLVGGDSPPLSPPWGEERRTHVAIDRVSGAAVPFDVSGTRVASEKPLRAGMVVALLHRREEDLDLLERALDVLSATGIGGERSSGAGGFRWERAALRIPLSAEPRGALLSLCCPRPDELEGGALDGPQETGYRLVERSGWIASPDWPGRRGRPVAMLAEGSYLSPLLRAPVGRMVDVTPETHPGDRHRVYRYGYGCFLDEGRALQ